MLAPIQIKLNDQPCTGSQEQVGLLANALIWNSQSINWQTDISQCVIDHFNAYVGWRECPLSVPVSYGVHEVHDWLV